MQWSQIGELLTALEKKDRATVAHTWRVTLYTQALAEAEGASADEVHALMLAAVLHDIGKIDIPDGILTKPGPLTIREVHIMRSHPARGHERLVEMGETDPLLLAMVRSHHERLDGSGYPDSLVEDEIPPQVRTLAVIDTFDALTSLRPYRSRVGHSAANNAIAELQTHAGRWYSVEAVNTFIALYKTGTLDWILHHLNDAKGLSELFGQHQQSSNHFSREYREI